MNVNFFVTLLLTCLLMYSCNKTFFSEEELKGAQKVQDLYGGSITKGLGKEFEGTKTFNSFQLTIANSLYIKPNQPDLDWNASGIAYTFFSRLDNNSNIDIIQVNLVENNKSYFSSSFKVSELKDIRESMKIKDEYIQTLRDNDFDKGILYFHDKLINDTVFRKQLLDLYHTQDSLFGKIESSRFLGYDYYFNKNTHQQVVHIIETLERQKKSVKLNLLFETQDAKISLLKFE